MIPGLRDAIGRLYMGEVEIGPGLNLTQNAAGQSVLSRPGSGNYVITDSPWNGEATPGFDNTAAITAAIAAMPDGDVLFFPPTGGSANGYEHTGLITIDKQISFRSELQYFGYGDWLTYTGAATAIKIAAQAVQLDGMGIKTSTGLVLIDAIGGTTCAGLEIQRCALIGAADRLLLTDTYFVKLHDLVLQGKTGGTGWFIEALDNANAWDVNNLRCDFGAADNYGVLAINSNVAVSNATSTGSRFANIWIDGMPAGNTAIRFYDNCLGLLVSNLRVESHGAKSIQIDANAGSITVIGGTMGGDSGTPSPVVIENNGKDCSFSGILFVSATVGLHNTGPSRRTKVGTIGTLGTVTTPVWNQSGEGFVQEHGDVYPGIALDIQGAPVRFAEATDLYPSLIIRPSFATITAPTEGMAWYKAGGDLAGLYYEGPTSGLGVGTHGPLRGGPASHGVFGNIEIMQGVNALHIRSGVTAVAMMELFRDLTDQYDRSGYVGFPSALAAEDWLEIRNAIGPIVLSTSNQQRWTLDANGHLFPVTDNVYDLGAGATRVRNLYASGLILPHGSAPGSPADGAMWTTTGGLYVRINGSTVGPLGTGGGGGPPTGAAGGDLAGTYPNPTIAARAVTIAKMQAISAGYVLGRSTAGSGDIEGILVGSGLSIAGGALTSSAATDATTSAKGIVQLAGDLAGTAAAPVIAARAVTIAKIQAINAGYVLGRVTAGSGDIESILVGSGLSIATGALAISFSGAWNGSHLVLGSGHLWRAASGHLYWNGSSAPTGDTDGTQLS